MLRPSDHVFSLACRVGVVETQLGQPADDLGSQLIVTDPTQRRHERHGPRRDEVHPAVAMPIPQEVGAEGGGVLEVCSCAGEVVAVFVGHLDEEFGQHLEQRSLECDSTVVDDRRDRIDRVEISDDRVVEEQTREEAGFFQLLASAPRQGGGLDELGSPRYVTIEEERDEPLHHATAVARLGMDRCVRKTSSSESNAEWMIESFAELESIFVFDVVRLTTNGQLNRVAVTRTTDGGRYLDNQVMFILVRDGKLARMETFESEDLDVALNRFDELTRS